MQIYCDLQLTVAILQGERKFPISALLQTTVNSQGLATPSMNEPESK